MKTIPTFHPFRHIGCAILAAVAVFVMNPASSVRAQEPTLQHNGPCGHCGLYHTGGCGSGSGGNAAPRNWGEAIAQGIQNYQAQKDADRARTLEQNRRRVAEPESPDWSNPTSVSHGSWDVPANAPTLPTTSLVPDSIRDFTVRPVAEPPAPKLPEPAPIPQRPVGGDVPVPAPVPAQPRQRSQAENLLLETAESILNSVPDRPAGGETPGPALAPAPAQPRQRSQAENLLLKTANTILSSVPELPDDRREFLRPEPEAETATGKVLRSGLEKLASGGQDQLARDSEWFGGSQMAGRWAEGVFEAREYIKQGVKGVEDAMDKLEDSAQAGWDQIAGALGFDPKTGKFSTTETLIMKPEQGTSGN